MFKKVKITYNPANRKFIRKKIGFWFKFFMFLKYNLVVELSEDFYASKRACKIKMRHRWEPILTILKRRTNMIQEEKDYSEDNMNGGEEIDNLPKFFPLSSLAEEPSHMDEIDNINYKKAKKNETEFVNAEEIDIEIEEQENSKVFKLEDIGIDTDSSIEILDFEEMNSDISTANANLLDLPSLDLDIQPKYKRPNNCHTTAN